jgi:hypothetical protein
MKQMIWGLVLQVIIGVATGLSIQPLQRRWEKRALSSRSKRLKRIRDEYQTTIYYALHPEFLICKLVLTTLGVCSYAIYLLFIVVLRGTPIEFWTLKVGFSIPRYIVGALDVASILLITILTTAVGRIALNTIYFFERVRGFERYVTNVPKEIRDRKMEKLILAIARERPTSALSPEGWEALVKSLKEGEEKTNSSDDPAS